MPEQCQLCRTTATLAVWPEGEESDDYVALCGLCEVGYKGCDPHPLYEVRPISSLQMTRPSRGKLEALASWLKG